ncbi:TonB-dependent siderophore receptor [Ferrovibrio sp.]|uniref:TonB-dependent siderophore receptor n=1 Tax=Ferrovibrio sp. TaxID=1917215 RepID=UPI00260BF184|nr:TonB-dependent siderophore receptor [Ferrovibrio sp.]
MNAKLVVRPVMPRLGGRRLFSLSASVVALAAGLNLATAAAQAQSTATPASSQQRMAFDIPTQELSRAVLALANRASIQILFDSARLQNLRSTAVSGSMTPQEALTRMLDGTGMGYRFTGPANVTLFEIPRSGDATVLPPVTVEGRSSQVETATDSVEGYVVSRARTGTKTDTPLLETSQSISVIPRDQIADQNAQTLNQVLRYTAGVTPETRGAVATRYDMFTIRGFDAHRYWNGLKQQDLYYFAPQLDPYLLERAEVLKGPNSTLYGQAPAGGLVNQVSKRPTDEALHEVGMEVGTNNHYRLTADMSDKVDAEGKLAYRFTVVGLTEDGQMKTTENERVSIAPSIAWRPDEDTSLILFGLYQSDPKGNSYGGIPPQATVLSNPYGTLPMDFYDGDPNFEKFVRHQTALGYEFDKRLNDIWTLRLNGRTLHGTLAYDSVYANGLQADNVTLNRGVATSRESMTSYVFDNQLEARVDTGPINHTMLGGLDYQIIDGHYATGFGTAPTLNIFNPVYGQTITVPARSRTNVDAEQYGLYLQDQMRLGGFIVTLGGRYDAAERTTTTVNTGAVTRQNDSAWTGKMGILYAFENGLSPYASYSEAFTPQSGTDFAGKPFDPEEGAQYELGLKYQPPGTNSLFTAAIFDVTRSNLKTGDPAHSGFSITVGEVQSRGFEFEARHSLTRQIDLLGSYTFLDTEVTKDNSGLQGKRVGAVPEHQASAWIMYHMPRDTSFRGLSLGSGIRYVGSTVNPANTIEVPSFTLVDAALNYDLGALSNTFAGVDVSVNVKNLFDKDYVASCYYGEWCAYGYERTLTAGLRYRW